MNCLVCDKEIQARPGRGRPRLTCGDRCRKRLQRSSFPPEMRNARRWTRCVGKRPVMVDGTPASSTDFQTWGNFKTVQSGAGDGFGFMLGGGFGCIDLDNCLVGGALSDRAREVLEANPNCFVEYSVSGRGLHIFGLLGECRGIKRRGVEVYSRARFIRTTGRAYRRGGLGKLVVPV